MNKENLLRGLPFLLILFYLFLQTAFIYEQSGKPHMEFFRDNPAFDSYRFITEARIIEETGFYESSPQRVLPPVYPLLISFFEKLFGQGSTAILFFQSFLSAISLSLVYLLAKNWFGREAALLSMAMAVLYGPFYLYSSVYLRANLITFESLAIVALLHAGRYRWQITGLAGVASAILTQTRPYPLSILAIAIFLIFPIFSNRNLSSLLRPAAFFTAFLLTTLIIPSPSSPKADPLGPAAHFLSGNVLDSDYGYNWGTTPIKEKLLEEGKGSKLETVLLVAKEIATHPMEYATFYYKKLRMFLGSFEIPSNYNFYLFQKELSAILPVAFLPFGWIVPFAAIGIIRAAGDIRRFLLPLIWFGALCLGIFIFIIQARYRLPAVPFFIIFAGFGITVLNDAVIRKLPSLKAYAIILIAMFYICRFDHSPLPAPITREDYKNLVIAYSKRGDEAKAMYYMKKETLLWPR